MAAVGYFYWPGMQAIMSGSFTFTHGTNPCVCTIYIAPQPLNDLAATGTLTIFWDGGEQQFENCLLNFISFDRGPDGKPTWGLHILDRRWLWRSTGAISGNYNVRRGNGDGNVWSQTAATVQELMELCLDAMGESDYDVSQVPDDDNPEIEWDYTLPSQALLELADKYGCRVVLKLDGTVAVLPSGEGAQLPTGTYMSGAIDYNPPNVPNRLVAASGRSVVQYDFKLEPVGIETDGTIWDVGNLTYSPSDWSAEDPRLLWTVKTDSPDAYDLAIKSVYRYYRIVVPINIPDVDQFGGDNGDITELAFILPINDVQITQAPETSETPAAPLPAWVYGVWYDGGAVAANVSDTADPTQITSDKSKGYYGGSFTIDKARGLVIFSDPVFKYNTVDGSHDFADLRLRTSFSVRDQETMGWLRYEKSQNTGAGTVASPPQYVVFDDVALQLIYNFDAQGNATFASNNQQLVDQACNIKLKGALQKYQLDQPASFTYPGFVFIELDGAIQQISWILGGDGPTTQVNRNKEDLTVVPSYQEAKQLQLIQQAIADKQKVARVQAQDLAANSGRG